jgi:non-ribosomal peptide synthetase component F
MTLISGYNATDEAIIPTTLQQLFINQVAKTPLNVAVEFQTKFLTYEELHRKSNQVAHYLMEQGIGGGNLVAVLAERCEHTIVNILGILKVGAAYVPVETEYPQERKDYIMRDSNCKLMLKPDVYVKENIGRYSTEEILVNGIDDVAYVIYTSGSTGRPKGVVITHRAATNTIIDINQRFNVNENDRILGISSMCFDLSVYDIFGALSTGATLIMIPDQKDVRCLIDAVRHKNITIWNSVPAIMGMVLDNLNISME